MVHFLIVRFLVVLFSFNLIDGFDSMEKKTNFDFELELFRNLIKESNPNESKPHWLVDHQQNSWITEVKSWITKAKERNGFIYKLLGQSSRTASIGPRKEIQIILRLFLVIALYCQASSIKPNKINHSTSRIASWLGRKPRYMQ